MTVAHLSPDRRMVRYATADDPVPDGWTSLPVTDATTREQGPGETRDEAGPVLISIEPNGVRRLWNVRPMTFGERLSRCYADRLDAYPPPGDQFDAVFRGFRALLDQGIILPAETRLWIDVCAAVKARYPKP